MSQNRFNLCLGLVCFMSMNTGLAQKEVSSKIAIKKISKAEYKKSSLSLINKSVRDQSVAELKHNLQWYINDGQHLEIIIKYLEALIPKLIDDTEIRDYRILLADILFKAGKYERAGSAYMEYHDAYPGYKQAEYALYCAILSKVELIGACDQDCTATHEVLDLCKQYLQNKSNQKHRAAVEGLAHKCNRQIFESELSVFEHYYKQGFLGSAQKRLDYVITKILPTDLTLQSLIDGLQDLINQAKKGLNPKKIWRKWISAYQFSQPFVKAKVSKPSRRSRVQHKMAIRRQKNAH